ncbi:multidrug ABC transporter ATPase [Microbacterium sp. bgisy189]|uniref:multidrug ABC transporter ATPase n=1 Tax=Microbacterium sp. bgisy189 TaxID=3413798 RepID=UPI003EBD0899
MSTRTPGEDLPVRRIDRILAFMSLGLLALSVVCFFAIMIGSATGMEQADFGTGIWPVVGATVYIAPILAFAMLMTVLIMTFVRRAKANKGR